uniref:Dehydrogenase/reductase SDR family member 7 n=1 Tax=Anisakis simplex TaxID=6269 RepID=A0A0M3IYY9_ANISI
LVLFIGFFAVSDSTLNLFICEKFGYSEGQHFVGKVIWVIGASSGIGEAVCKRLASNYQCRLIISARRENNLEVVARSCTKFGQLSAEDIYVLPLDITKFDTFEQKVDLANSYFNRHVDIILLCSGQSQRAEWHEVEASVDEQCYRVNALGPTVLSRFAIRHYQKHSLKSELQFIVISSICGIVPAPLSPSYTAAKHALMGYFRLLNLEYSDSRITATIVCPSLTYSPNNVFNAFTGIPGKRNEEIITEQSAKHMSCERAAELILVAGANHLAEVSLSKTALPLLFAYSFTLFPDITFRMIRAIGSKYIRKMRTGAD